MNNFKVGINFDFNLLDAIIEINEQSDSDKITELYGSDAKHSELAARPAFRLPDVSANELERYVKKAKANGITFNYTMNSMLPYGSKIELCKHSDELKHFIKFLESIGARRITIANPMLLEVIRNYIKSDIEIEISTCAHIDTVTQIKYYHENYNVNKICCNLNKNRDFKFLTSAAKYCNEHNIIFELMVNEFCGVGGDGYATHCIYRDSCYLCHATNNTYDDSILLNNYPMSLCTMSRNKDKSNWLKLRWIRPEDIEVYNAIGINHFKITGRTGSTEYITKTIKAYMNRKYDGNLIELWKPLESIKPGTNESDIKQLFIDNSKLNGFINYWLGGHCCDNEVCGETCRYCNNFMEKLEAKNV
jgi:collagenase-like PrtC family protease